MICNDIWWKYLMIFNVVIAMNPRITVVKMLEARAARGQIWRYLKLKTDCKKIWQEWHEWRLCMASNNLLEGSVNVDLVLPLPWLEVEGMQGTGQLQAGELPLGTSVVGCLQHANPKEDAGHAKEGWQHQISRTGSCHSPEVSAVPSCIFD